MGTRYVNSGQATESLLECPTMGTVSNPSEGTGRKVRLYQRLAYQFTGSIFWSGDYFHRCTGIMPFEKLKKRALIYDPASGP